MVDLTQGLRIPPFEPGAYSMTSPPVVVNGLVVTGSSVADNTRPDLPSGEVRAFDARTGALKWTWDPMPQNPADPAYREWRGAMAHKTGAANAWSVLAADPERDLVFVPTGSAAPDYYGALRLGDNRYANSIVALRASTGEVAWAFQTVHHDLWDYDNASPPALVTLTRDGRRDARRRCRRRRPECSSCSIARPARPCSRSRNARCRRATSRSRKPRARSRSRRSRRR